MPYVTVPKDLTKVKNPLFGKSCKQCRKQLRRNIRRSSKVRSVEMANRTRNIEVRFRVTQDELEMIHKKMAQYGTTNLSAFLRKMSIDGYVVKLELPELKEMVSLLRYSSNNLNQLTKRVHETGRIYDADLEDLRQSHERLWDAARDILSALAKLN